MNMSNNCRNNRCLIVEDNSFAAEIMAIFFDRNGIDCEIAENGQIGLQKFLQNPKLYDVIFLDLQMPIMDGYEMTKHIRKSGLATAASIPIVAMSGTITGDWTGEESFNYFLKKPFELSCLLGVISEVTKQNI